MRTFLHKLMVDITRHPREIVTPGVDFEWDTTNSRAWQAFRAYEYFFGRREGIRFEGGSYKDELGRDCWKFGTWENVAVFVEEMIRLFFKGLVPKFVIVRVPQLVTVNGMYIDSPFRFAIAFDNAQATAVSSGASTLSCVVTGSNGFLWGKNYDAVSSAGATGTFNAVAMTQSTIATWFPTTEWHNFLYLASPATGTHNLVISNEQSFGGVAASSYSGVFQGTPDVFGSIQGTTASETLTINTATTNCWMIVGVAGSNGTATAGTNSTFRTGGAIGGGQPGLFDSNGTITTGGFSMTVSGFMAGQNNGMVGYTFTQVVAATVNSGFSFVVDR